MSDPSEASQATTEALIVLGRLPKTVRTVILSDEIIRDRLGLTGKRPLTVAPGLEVDRDELLRGARDATSEGRPATFRTVDGKEGRIEAVGIDPGTRLRFRLTVSTGEPAHVLLPAMIFAHPDKSVRLEAFRTLIPTLGMSSTLDEEWRRKVAERALEWGEVLELQKCLEESPVEVLRSLQARLRMAGRVGGEVSLSLLLPSSLTYYTRVLPPPGAARTRADYRDQVLLPFLTYWLREAPATSVRLFLPLPLDASCSFGGVAAAVSDSDLGQAMANGQAIYDPISRLNLLDIALTRYDRGEEYRELAKRMTAELLQDKSCVRDLPKWDVYVLFPALLRFVAAEFRVRPELRGLPAFWRTMCAWAHAGTLVQLLQDADLDAQGFADDLLAADLLPVSALVDLIEDPVGSVLPTSPTMIAGVAKASLIAVMASKPTTARAVLASADMLAAITRAVAGGTEALRSGWASPLISPASPAEELVENIQKLGIEDVDTSKVFAAWRDVIDRAVDDLLRNRQEREALIILRNASFLVGFSERVQERLIEYLRTRRPRQMTISVARQTAELYPLLAELTYRLQNVEMRGEAVRLAEELLVVLNEPNTVWEILGAVVLAAAQRGDPCSSTRALSGAVERVVRLTSDQEALKRLRGLLEQMLLVFPVNQASGLGRALALCRARL